MGYTLTQEGFNMAEVLAVFIKELDIHEDVSPPELELSYYEIKEKVIAEPVKERLYEVLERLTDLELIEYEPD